MNNTSALKQSIRRVLPNATEISIKKNSIYSDKQTVSLNHPWSNRLEYIAIKKTIEDLTGLRIDGICNR